MTHRIHSGKGGGRGKREKMRELGLSPPLPLLRWPHRLRQEGHIQVFYASILPNLLKRKLLQTFALTTVQVWIFTSLDRNDLKQSLRISEILLSINAKVLFLAILILSCIRHPVCDTSRGHIRSLSSSLLDNRDTKKKK